MILLRTIFANRRASPGWAMPMGWFAWFGMMIPLTFGFNGWLQNVVFASASWITLWFMGLVGTASIGFESCRNIYRYGVNGIVRPRFYFELSRAILAIVFLTWAPALTFTFLFPNVIVPFANSINVRHFGSVLVLFFCLFASCGYLLSFLSGRGRRGRAYECTSWFYCVFGGIALVTHGFIAIPVPWNGAGNTIPSIIACALGLVLLTCGILAETSRAKRTEPSNARIVLEIVEDE